MGYRLSSIPGAPREASIEAGPDWECLKEITVLAIFTLKSVAVSRP